MSPQTTQGYLHHLAGSAADKTARDLVDRHSGGTRGHTLTGGDEALGGGATL